MPVISSTVSPFRRSAVTNAPNCDGVAVPDISSSMQAAASASVRSRRSASLHDRVADGEVSHCVLDHTPIARKFFRIVCPSGVRMDSGWNCTPSTASFPVADAHDHARSRCARSPRGRPARCPAGSRASGSAWPGAATCTPANTPLPSCVTAETLPCRISPAPSTMPPNTSPMHWWPRHTPRIGTLPAKRLMTSLLMPASLGLPGPGEMMMCVGRDLVDVLDRDRVVPHDLHLRAQLTQVLVEVVGEAVVVVDQKDAHRFLALITRV